MPCAKRRRQFVMTSKKEKSKTKQKIRKTIGDNDMMQKEKSEREKKVQFQRETDEYGKKKKSFTNLQI